MFRQAVKPFTTLVFGFLIGISAAEIYHMETQAAQVETCISAAKERGNATSVMSFAKSGDTVVDLPTKISLRQ